MAGISVKIGEVATKINLHDYRKGNYYLGGVLKEMKNGTPIKDLRKEVLSKIGKDENLTREEKEAVGKLSDEGLVSLLQYAEAHQAVLGSRGTLMKIATDTKNIAQRNNLGMDSEIARIDQGIESFKKSIDFTDTLALTELEATETRRAVGAIAQNIESKHTTASEERLGNVFVGMSTFLGLKPGNVKGGDAEGTREYQAECQRCKDVISRLDTTLDSLAKDTSQEVGDLRLAQLAGRIYRASKENMSIDVLAERVLEAACEYESKIKMTNVTEQRRNELSSQIKKELGGGLYRELQKERDGKERDGKEGFVGRLVEFFKKILSIGQGQERSSDQQRANDEHAQHQKGKEGMAGRKWTELVLTSEANKRDEHSR